MHTATRRAEQFARILPIRNQMVQKAGTAEPALPNETVGLAGARPYKSNSTGRITCPTGRCPARTCLRYSSSGLGPSDRAMAAFEGSPDGLGKAGAAAEQGCSGSRRTAVRLLAAREAAI